MAGTIKHEWVGTTLVITSDSGSSGCDLKGDRGDIGIRGPQGPQGEKPEVFFTVGLEDDTVLDTEWKELNVNGTRVLESINLHTSDMNNPHGITCEQIGAEVVGSAAAVQGQLLAHIEEINPHNTTAAAIGLDKVDNTADIDKPVSTAQQAAIDEVKDLVDANTETINSMNDASTGILAQAKEYMNEQLGGVGEGTVVSVNGKAGVVVLEKVDLGLENVDNTADADKPVSTAQQEAINTAVANYMPKSGGTFTGAVKLASGSSINTGGDTTATLLRNITYTTSTSAIPNGNGVLVLFYG
jgi:hypothetical protein